MNSRQKMDGLELLRRIPRGSIDLAFLDPQYRTGLDHLKFGNEGSRQKKRYNLPQMDDETISDFVQHCGRVLRPSAHLLLWVDKFAIGSGRHLHYIRNADLQVVDLITWNKMNIGMGRRARCTTEFLVVLQKPPIRAEGCWTDHSIRDCWGEHADKDVHAHCKPFVLTERLIRATTKLGDTVLDPCAGGWGVLEACKASNRNFVGCDLNG